MMLSHPRDAGVWHASVRDAIAQELDTLASKTASLGDQLCDDAAVVERHLIDLQEIDRIGQMLTCLAAMLRADDLGAAVSNLPIRELAERLEDRIGLTRGARG